MCDTEKNKLDDENRELKAKIKALEERIAQLAFQRELEYQRGVIEGLKFSLRCNGVSGGEIKG